MLPQPTKKISRKQLALLYISSLIALADHIRDHAGEMDVTSTPYYHGLMQEIGTGNPESVQQHIVAAQHLERSLALRSPGSIPASLIRTAQDSVLESLLGFLYVTGVRNPTDEALLRETGRLVVRNAYPRALSSYAAGAFHDFSVHRLPLAVLGTHSLLATEQPARRQREIATMLLYHRWLKAYEVKAKVQGNPNTAIRSEATGHVMLNFQPKHWQQITWRLGYTTVFDLLLDAPKGMIWPERMVEGFHDALCTIVSAINMVHSTYITKAFPALCEPI